MAAIVNAADVLLQATSPRMVTVALDPNVVVPALKGVIITAPSAIFQVNVSGTASPTSITLTATNRQITGAVAWSVTSGTATLTSTTAVSPATAVLTYANLGSATATIRATVVENGVTYTADYTIGKVSDGTSGTAFWIGPGPSAITKSQAGAYTPATAAFSALTSGGGAAPVAYSGRWTVETTADGTTYSLQYTSSVDESAINYSVPAGIVAIRVRLYLAGGTINLIDEDVIPVVTDGSNTVTVVVTNPVQTLPSDSSGTVASYANTGTNIQVYEGSTLLTYTTGALANSKFSIGTITQSPAASITLGALSGNGTTAATIANHSALTADSVQVGYPITVQRSSGVQETRTVYQTLSKSKAGSSGARGSLVGWGSAYGITTSSWPDANPFAGSVNDNRANAVIWNILNGSASVSVSTTSHLVPGDQVTLGNGSSFAKLKYWNGFAWIQPGTVIDGALLVTGSVTATSIGVTYLSSIQANLGSVTLDTAGSIKGGQTDYNTGTGFFLGYSSTTYKFSVGNSGGDQLTWNGSTLNFIGALTGTGSINITGNARFKGAYAGTQATAAVYANESDTAITGVFGRTSATLAGAGATGAGVHGFAAGTESIGVSGVASGGIGVSGTTSSTSNAAIRGNNTGTGPSLEAVTSLKVGTGATIGTGLTVTSGNVTASSGSVSASAVVTAGTGITATTGNITASAGRVTATASSGDAAVSGNASGASTHGVHAGNTTAGTSGIVGGSNGYNFYADGTPTGSFDYGTFTGAHDALMTAAQFNSVELGDIVVDFMVVGKHNLSNSITEVRRSNLANQKGALGAYVGVSPVQFNDANPFIPNGMRALSDADLAAAMAKYKYVVVNALGEGEINVCGMGGDIEIGDLIVTSNLPGKGMKQADDIVRGYTVAKSREKVTFANPAEVKSVACIYISG